MPAMILPCSGEQNLFWKKFVLERQETDAVPKPAKSAGLDRYNEAHYGIIKEYTLQQLQKYFRFKLFNNAALVQVE